MPTIRQKSKETPISRSVHKPHDGLFRAPGLKWNARLNNRLYSHDSKLIIFKNNTLNLQLCWTRCCLVFVIRTSWLAQRCNWIRSWSKFSSVATVVLVAKWGVHCVLAPSCARFSGRAREWFLEMLVTSAPEVGPSVALPCNYLNLTCGGPCALCLWGFVPLC